MKVRRAANVFVTDVDGETVLLNSATGQYFSLDGTGRVIWSTLGAGIEESDLCTQLAESHDVDPETCRRDVTAFLQALAQAGLVERS